MANVGELIFQNKNFAEGTIRTRTMKLNIRVYRVENKQSDKHPDFDVREVMDDGPEVNIGSGYVNKIKNGPNAGNDFISLNMDDPSFPMTLEVAVYHKQGDLHEIVWNRPREKSK